MKARIEEMSEADAALVVAKMDELRPRVLPAEWRVLEDYANCCWFVSRDGLKVAVEVECNDTRLWLHVSFSRRDRDPSWFDTKRVKDLFVGRGRKALQVLPAESEYVNLHPHCLHLYAALEYDPLPDFRFASGDL